MNKSMSITSILAVTLAFASAASAQHSAGHNEKAQTGAHSGMSSMQHGGMQHGDMKMGGMSGMKMGMSGMTALKSLSGRQFDIAFLSQMSQHHQGALDMTKDALPNLKNARVRKHAQNIIADQKKEIAEMRAILQKDFQTKPSMAQMNMMKKDMQGMMGMKSTNDRMFLEMMIPHHQGANDMSRLALQKSKNPKVRSLAQRIVKAQTAEIKDFQMLLKSGGLATSAATTAATTYKCPTCKMTFSAADAKKMGYQCSMKDGKLVPVAKQ